MQRRAEATLAPLKYFTVHANLWLYLYIINVFYFQIVVVFVIYSNNALMSVEMYSDLIGTTGELHVSFMNIVASFKPGE